MTRRLLGTLLLALTFGLTSGSATGGQSLAELMEKAIYTEETLGDLDAAIRIYQQVIAGSIPDTVVRTHAERRLEAARERRRTVPAVPLATFDGRTYRHTKTGVTFEVPAGWGMFPTSPSSDNGEMVSMLAPSPGAMMSVWMIRERHDASAVNRLLDGAPAEKVTQRQGYTGYRIVEATRTLVNGKPAMKGFAEYRDGDVPMVELLTWVYTENTRAFFFVRLRADAVDPFRDQFDSVVYTSLVP